MELWIPSFSETFDINEFSKIYDVVNKKKYEACRRLSFKIAISFVARKTVSCSGSGDSFPTG
jgi:hypothetical protein